MKAFRFAALFALVQLSAAPVFAEDEQSQESSSIEEDRFQGSDDDDDSSASDPGTKDDPESTPEPSDLDSKDSDWREYRPPASQGGVRG